MPRRVAVSTLNASTVDIINTIRANASQEYQSSVPAISTEVEIPKVGEVLYGYPALANQFISALVNRIALVAIKGATFNNAYAKFKKGYLEYGETVEEVFTEIIKARVFSPEKAEARELKRSLPNVKSAFHAINWKVQYPITIEQEELRMAFLSAQGVQDLIAKIIDQVYVSAEYDEFLLFKYLIIKAVSHGKMHPVAVGDGTDLKVDASKFRAVSNMLPFMKNTYNEAGVTTNTPKAKQAIFMDATYNAEFDVNVLASAFNMEKAEFIGSLNLIDDFTTFDNDRFSVIREESDMLEEVTADELALMADVKAVLIDTDWFQIYDNLTQMSEKFVASGLYWNYFYNTWKTISTSPFSNAVVFVESGATTSLPSSITVEVVSTSVSAEATVLTLAVDDSDESLQPNALNFVQNQSATTAGIAVHPYGAVIIPASYTGAGIILTATLDGVTYTAGTAISADVEGGATITFTKQA